MISIDKKFIFVAVMKTGTMSITKTLEKYSLDNDGTHYTAKELKEGRLLSHSSKRLGANNSSIPLYKKHWDEFFTFGFVRNPWDHFVSLYKWCKKHNSKQALNGFDNFLKNQYESNFGILWDWQFTNQSDRLFDKDNQLVDFIGKFENLEEDYLKICNRLMIKEPLLYINKSKDIRTYREFYKNDKQIEMVNKMYKKDIERFKYEFE